MAKGAPRKGDEWMKFLESQVGGILPCINDGMFPNNSMANKTLLQFLCPIGTVVLVRIGKEEPRFAEIMVSLGRRIKVAFLNSRNEKAIWTDIDSIVTNPTALRTAKSKATLKPDQEKKMYDIKLFAKYKSDLDTKMCELVKVGSWLEVQSKKEPSFVYYSKVLENHGGMLKVENKHEGINQYIHMFDPFCHYVGWALEQDSELREQDQDVMYSDFCKQVDFSEVEANRVPEIVFRNNKIKRHNLKVGSMLAVSAPSNHEFYYAHVNHIISSHFFTVMVGDGYHVDLKHGPLHIESPVLYPCNFLENIGVPLKQPILIKKRVENWDDYKKIYGKSNQENFTEVENCGLIKKYENDEEIDDIGSNICTMRYIEMFQDFGKNMVYMFAAEILRNEKSMIWIRTHFTKNLLVLHFTDNRLFPCGFGKKFNIPVYFENDKKLAIDPDFGRITHEITGISNGRDIFMPRHVDEKHFVPRLFVHAKCEIGPFLDRKLVNSLQTIFERGSQKDMLREIYKCIMICVKPQKRNQVHQMYQKSLEDDKPHCITPLIITKYRRNVSDGSQTLRAATCDSSDKMHSFVKALLHTIEACPHLISFENTSCPYECRKTRRAHYEKKRMFEQKMAARKMRAAAKKKMMLQKAMDEKKKKKKMLARTECEPSTSGTQVLVNEERNGNMSTDSGIGEKRRSTESIDDIFGGHKRSLLKRMEDAANEKILLPPLPPKIVKTTPPIVLKRSRPSYPPMTSKQQNQKASPSVGIVGPMPNPMYPPLPHGLTQAQIYQQHMAMMKTSPQQQAAFMQHLQHTPQMRNMAMPPPMHPQFSPQMLMMMQQQYYSQQLAAQQMMQQQQQQQQKQAKTHRSPSTSGIFPMPSTSGTNGNGSGSSSSTSGSGSGSGSGSKPDTIVVAGPTKEIVSTWSDEQLSDYLRNNMLNLGSDAIRILKDNRISGKVLLSLNQEQCNALMGTTGQGESLMRFIQWVLEKSKKQ